MQSTCPLVRDGRPGKAGVRFHEGDTPCQRDGGGSVPFALASSQADRLGGMDSDISDHVVDAIWNCFHKRFKERGCGSCASLAIGGGYCFFHLATVFGLMLLRRTKALMLPCPTISPHK